MLYSRRYSDLHPQNAYGDPPQTRPTHQGKAFPQNSLAG